MDALHSARNAFARALLGALCACALPVLLLAPAFFGGEAWARHSVEPHAPKITTLYSGQSSVGVTWTDPEIGNQGLPISKYQIYVQYAHCPSNWSWHALTNQFSCWLKSNGRYAWSQRIADLHWEPVESERIFVTGQRHYELKGVPSSEARYWVKVVAFDSYGWKSAASVEREIFRNSPPPPKITSVYLRDDRIYFTWERGQNPHWMTAGNTVNPAGYALRWVNRTAARVHKFDWPSSGIGNLNKASGQGYVDLSTNLRASSFTVAPGNEYAFQLSAWHGGRPGWWPQPVTVYYDRRTLTVHSGTNAGMAGRVGWNFDTPFSETENDRVYNIGPLRPNHGYIQVHLNDTATNVPKTYDPGGANEHTCSNKRSCIWTLPVSESVQDFKFAYTVDGSEKRFTIRANKLNPGCGSAPGCAPAPDGLTLSTGEYYTGEGNQTRPEIVVAWDSWRYANFYAISCRDTSDAGVNVCTDDAANDEKYTNLVLLPKQANGMVSYTLRPPELYFGDEYSVDVQTKWYERLGAKSTATISTRAARTDATLSTLQIAPATLALQPAFHPSNTEYTLLVEYAEDATLTATATDNNATFAVTNADALTGDSVGESTVTVTVTAEDLTTTQDYTINVVRYPRISDLQYAAVVDGEDIPVAPVTANFSPTDTHSVTTYRLRSAYSAGKFLLYRFADIAAHVQFQDENGDALTSSVAGTLENSPQDERVAYAVDVPAGGGLYTLTASHGGDFTATYTARLLRSLTESNASSLRALRLEDANGANVAFYPASTVFAPQTHTYIVRTTADFTVHFEADEYATVQLQEDGEAISGNSFSVSPERGISFLRMFVTAENGINRSEYLLRVESHVPTGTEPAVDISFTDTGAAQPVAVQEVPDFVPTTFVYDLQMPAGSTVVTVNTALPTSGVTAQMRLRGVSGRWIPTGRLTLQPGDNYIEVRFTQASPLQRTVYVTRVNVRPPVSGDATLHSVRAYARGSEIEFAQDGGTPNAGFAPTHHNYTVETSRLTQNVIFIFDAHEDAVISIGDDTIAAGAEYTAALQPGEYTLQVKVTAPSGGAITYAFKFTRSAVTTAPLPPAMLTLSSPTAGAMRAEVTPPLADGGDTVRTYIARWGEVDSAVVWSDPPGESGMAVTPAAGGGATTFEIANAPPGVTYEVQVAAANTIGVGEWALVRGASSGFVLAPPALGLVAGDRRITAEWSASADGGTTISKYVVRHAAGNGAWENALGTDVAASSAVSGKYSHRISNLQNDTTYRVQIAAHNEFGRGPWSASETTTPRFAILAAPGNLVAIGGERRILLTGIRPVGFNSDSDEFRVRWTQASREAQRRWNNVDGVASPPHAGNVQHAIDNLCPGVTYEVQVAAKNATGIGNWASVTATPHAFSLDVNADGTVTAADGIIVARRLLGVSEEGGLYDGQLDWESLTAQEKANIRDNLNRGTVCKILDVDNDDSDPDGEDGLHVARYLMGLRGVSLDRDAGKESTVRGRVQALMTP